MPTDNELIAQWQQSAQVGGGASSSVSDDDLAAQWESAKAEIPTLGSEGRGVLNHLMKGGADLIGLVADYNPATVSDTLSRQIASRITGVDPEVQSSSDLVQSGMKSVGLMTDAEPRTKTGRILGRVAEFLPSAAIPAGGGPLLRAATAASGGLASGVMREVTDNPWADLTASLLGSLGVASIPSATKGTVTLVKQAIEPLTQAAPPKIAGQILQDVAQDPQLASKLAKAARSQPFTTAEATQNPGLAQLEKHLLKTNPEYGAEYGAMMAKRSGAREEMVSALAGGGEVAAADVGPQVRSGLEDAAKKAYGPVKKAYNSIDPRGTSKIPIFEAKMAIQDAKAAMFPKEISPPISGATQQLFDEFVNAKNTQPWQWLQAARSKAGSLASMAARSGNNVEAKFANMIKDAADEAMQRAADTGRGFKPGQAETAQMARALRSQFGETYQRGAVGSVLKKKQFGEYAVREADVPKRLLRDPEAIQQFSKAAGKEAVEPLRNVIMSEMLQRPQARWPDWISKNQPRLKALLDEKHLDTLEAIANDIVSEKSVSNLANIASKGGSNTVQGLTTLEYIKQRALPSMGTRREIGLAITGGLFGGLPGAALGGALGEGLRRGYAAQAEKVNELLFRAALDPKIAQELVKSATPQRVESVLAELQRITAETASRSTVTDLGAGQSPRPPQAPTTIESTAGQVSTR